MNRFHYAASREPEPSFFRIAFPVTAFSIPKPATGRRENVSLTQLIYNMLKKSPTESFFQKFFIFFSRRTYARQIIQTSAFSQRHLCMQNILCRWESNRIRFRSYVPATVPNPLQASVLICPDSSFFYTFFSPFLRIISASAFF